MKNLVDLLKSLVTTAYVGCTACAPIPREQRMKGGLKDRFIRISVGLERARDIVDDLRKLIDLCDDEGCGVPEDL